MPTNRIRFWRVISNITKNRLPTTYDGKKQLLREAKIGLWDVLHTAKRAGSLDSEITDETPNDLGTFIAKHNNLKVIAFNGKKAEALFDKYFARKDGLRYVSLPSTSSANTRLTFEKMCQAWEAITKL